MNFYRYFGGSSFVYASYIYLSISKCAYLYSNNSPKMFYFLQKTMKKYTMS